MGDNHFPASQGWVKMEILDHGVEIHYVFNPSTGEATDFKFKTMRSRCAFDAKIEVVAIY